MRPKIIDAHTHPFSCPIELFLEEMELAGAQACVALFSIRNPADVDKPQVRQRIHARLPKNLLPREDQIFEDMRDYIGSLPSISNRDAASLGSRYRGLIIPFGSVYVNGTETELERQLAEVDALNLKGIKLLPTLQLFNPSGSENFETICEWCEKKGKIITFHTGCDPGPFEIPEVAEDANPKYLIPALEKYKPTIILGHFGAYSAYHPGIWFEEALSVAKEFENVYGDTSAATGFLVQKDIAMKIREQVGFERILFGSDFPVVWGCTIKSEVDTIIAAESLSQEEKELVLFRNAKRIFGVES